MLVTATNSLVRVLLCPECAACGVELDRPLAGPVCGACWRAVSRITPPTCVRCGDALASGVAGPLCTRCRERPRSLAIARSAGRYEGSLRKIIHAFKYEGRRVLAAPLAKLMRDAGADLLAGADAVVPVPLHPWRGMRRGFNQADDLARQLGPPVWRALRRRRHGPPQAGLPAAARHANVQAAYALGLRSFALPCLRNRVVILVDDVMTTGATVEACARVLAGAGVRSVGVLTAARAMAGSPDPPPSTPRLSTARRR
jgi:ComF family protein